MNGLGENIKKARESLKISQEDLAKFLGVKQATVSSWERDRTEPNFEMYYKMCSIFDMSLGELVGDSGYLERENNRNPLKELPDSDDENDVLTNKCLTGAMIAVRSDVLNAHYLNVILGIYRNKSLNSGSKYFAICNKLEELDALLTFNSARLFEDAAGDEV